MMSVPETGRDDLPDVRECPGCEDVETAPHAFDCPRWAPATAVAGGISSQAGLASIRSGL